MRPSASSAGFEDGLVPVDGIQAPDKSVEADPSEHDQCATSSLKVLRISPDHRQLGIPNRSGLV
jgi:hypothetical protein